MKATQEVVRVRRRYNQWVANETLEDYALRFTAKSARRWSSARVSHTALAAISFLALEAIGGAITLNYGFHNAIAAVMVVGAIIFLTSIPISYHAAKQGIDIDLLTRGAGFGYIGSTITSLIYASFTFIFFALEAAILSLALELTLGIPLFIGYVISSLIVIPLVTHGITLISRFQVWTQPAWIVLQVIPLLCIAVQSEDALALWEGYQPPSLVENEGGGHFNLLAFGAASHARTRRQSVRGACTSSAPERAPRPPRQPTQRQGKGEGGRSQAKPRGPCMSMFYTFLCAGGTLR